MMRNERGYTLIELMVALTLGLLVSAAAISMLLASRSSLVTQQSNADIQDASVFGVERLATSLRMANYTGTDPVMMTGTSASGILFNAVAALGATDSANFVSNSAVVQDNTDVMSDQLTVSYRAQPQLLEAPGGGALTCDGTRAFPISAAVIGDITAANIHQVNVVVYERYFVRAIPNAASTLDVRPLALYCDGITIITVTDAAGAVVNTTVDNAAAAQLMIPNIDHFAVRLLVVNPATQTTALMSLSDYRSNASSVPIAGLKFSLLLRAQQAERQSKQETKFKVFGTDVIAKGTHAAQFKRQQFVRVIDVGNRALY